MFPNASNTSISLLNVVSTLDKLGNKSLVIRSSKEVVGITKSITSSEFQTSVMIGVNYDFKVVIQAPIYDGSKYAKVKNTIYKISRTYVNGQFIELYLVSTDLKEEDFMDERNS